MAERITILLIDDDEDEHFLTQDRLDEVARAAFDVHWAATFEAGMDALASGLYDVCLLDYRLGARTGLELLQAATTLDISTLFILLTGQGDRRVDEAAIAGGAVDYLEKQEITPRLLERTIRHALERQRIRAALEESEAHYRLLAETAQELFLIHDTQGNIQYVNRAALSLLGYSSEEELIGLPIDSIISPDEISEPAARAALREAGTHLRRRYEIDVIRSDGRIMPLEVSSSPLVRQGDVRAIFVVGRDITEQRAVQARLLAYSNELEARVAVRTAELQSQVARTRAILESTPEGLVVADPEGSILELNPVAERWLHDAISSQDATLLRGEIRRLAQQGEAPAVSSLELSGMDLDLTAIPVVTDPAGPDAVVIHIHDVTHLMALTRMQQSFIRSISHELRTPLTAVKLYASMVDQHPTKVDIYLPSLVQGIDRLSALVDDVLVVARLDAGRQVLTRAPIEAGDLASRVIDALEPLANSHSVQLKLTAGDPITAFGDPTALEQALWQLVKNAVLYSATGSCVVLSYGRDDAADPPHVWWRVADEGFGIPPDELPHVFDRFFRGQAVLETKIAGTGLGLAIAQQIAVMHGGTIDVQSELEEGSVFTLHVPAAEDLDVADTEAAP